MKVDKKTGYGLRMQAWALVSFKGAVPRLCIGRVFGVYQTKKEANEWARGTGYKAVPVIVAVGTVCSMTDCHVVHDPNWGKK